MREMGKGVVAIGLLVAVASLVWWSGLAPRWLGRLPGDIRIKRGDAAFYFPIVTCIIVSVAASLIFSFFRR